MAQDVELTFEKYAEALLGWSIFARNEFHGNNYSKMFYFLNLANRSLKKVQYRNNVGMKDLPIMEETKGLRTLFNGAQAATEYLLEFGNELAQEVVAETDWRKLLEKANKDNYVRLSKSLALKVELQPKKIEKLKEKVESRFAVLIEVLKNARNTMKTKPWENVNLLVLPQNKPILQLFFQRQKFYSKYDLNQWLIILHHLPLVGCDLSSLDLSDVPFNNINLERTNFSNANLEGCRFSRCILKGAIFKKADVVGANFTGSFDLTIGQLLQMENPGKAIGLVTVSKGTTANLKAAASLAA